MNTDTLTISFSIAKTDGEFEQIIHLQKQNHLSSLSDELLADQGFVFAEHTLPILKNMATHLPQVIALYSNRVIGYNLAMSSEMRNELPSLAPMFDEFDKCVYKGKQLNEYKFVIGGQVCVDKNFRGIGLMSKLYKETANRLPKDFELCVTEISRRNTKSLNAHQKMGFEIIADYNDGNEHWNIVAWEF
jgi:GNAT superfamily N-acetyltransferase